MIQIRADTSRCVGSGQCVLTDSTVFDQDDDGIVVVLTDHPGRRATAQARDAVTLCPSQALSIVQAEVRSEA